MDLVCSENLKERTAQRDNTIFGDDRVLENLLRDEYKYTPKIDYFLKLQSQLLPYMRKTVTTWMMELCEEQMIEEQVFPLAVNLLDRFLCLCKIKAEHLQLLGAVCLLISSKFRSTNVLTIGLLRAYTADSFSDDDIKHWEILVLSKLQWDVNGVTPFDFVDQVLQRHEWGMDNDRLRRHAHTLVGVCATEPSLLQKRPSLVAAACISSAIRGLKLLSAEDAVEDTCNLLKIRKPRMEILAAIIENTLVKLVVNSDYLDSEPVDYVIPQPRSEIADLIY